MSFSYNEELILESNPIVERLLCRMDRRSVINSIQEVALKAITITNLKQEFCDLNKKYPSTPLLTGEQVKNYFVIVLNGIDMTWRKVALEHSLLRDYKDEPLYENVFTFFDNLVDEINFDVLFHKEIKYINQK